MLASIFTSFDPILTPLESPVTLILPIMITLMAMQSYWMIPTTTSRLQTSVICGMKSLVKPNVGFNMKGMHMTITTTFYSLFLLNIVGMIPYVFSMTSHLNFTLSMAFPLWFTMILVSMNKSPKKTMAKLLPEGTPTPINPFLATVELISSCVRPLTLAFRLAANISAGHVILAMVASFMSNTLLSSTILKFIAMIIMVGAYSMFEIIICMIQAFVFVLLLSMYSNDYF
uniref:ATP synthase subunit a n=1 Tax=Trypanobia cryptica TaxID=2814713 RepID=A0A0K0YD78_9ANNE|nr:ATP synthase F0 subunit 6 [Trypanobia cryptica]